MLRDWSSWTFPLHSTVSTTPSCVGACSHHSTCLVQRHDGSSRICILGRSTSDVVRWGLQWSIFFVEYRKDRCLDLFCSLSTRQIWLLSLNGTVFVLTCMPTIHRFMAPADPLQLTISSSACQPVSTMSLRTHGGQSPTLICSPCDEWRSCYSAKTSQHYPRNVRQICPVPSYCGEICVSV